MKHPIKMTPKIAIVVYVLLSVLNEDITMLEATLQHCIEMDYLHKTFLLDDGNRAEMKSLAAGWATEKYHVNICFLSLFKLIKK